jgi:hypothetical protein
MALAQQYVVNIPSGFPEDEPVTIDSRETEPCEFYGTDLHVLRISNGAMLLSTMSLRRFQGQLIQFLAIYKETRNKGGKGAGHARTIRVPDDQYGSENYLVLDGWPSHPYDGDEEELDQNGNPWEQEYFCLSMGSAYEITDPAEQAWYGFGPLAKRPYGPLTEQQHEAIHNHRARYTANYMSPFNSGASTLLKIENVKQLARDLRDYCDAYEGRKADCTLSSSLA